ncbi:MAG: hypothetical protein RLZZ04_1171 [Cyanobacteriota bacterium]|jgi:hypothetical protein
MRAIADGLKRRRINVTTTPEVSHHLIFRLAIAKSRQNLIGFKIKSKRKAIALGKAIAFFSCSNQT